MKNSIHDISAAGDFNLGAPLFRAINSVHQIAVFSGVCGWSLAEADSSDNLIL